MTIKIKVAVKFVDILHRVDITSNVNQLAIFYQMIGPPDTLAGRINDRISDILSGDNGINYRFAFAFLY